MKIAPHSKLVMIGDSVTDAERGRPVGEGLWGAYGKGYVCQVEALLRITYPVHAIRVVNQGLSGNTVRDLKSRWQQDVLDLKPDWLSIMIGMNDVWRHFDSPRQTEALVHYEEYAATLKELVESTRPLLKGLVLMSPYMIEPNKADRMRAQMDRYGAAVRKLAETKDAIFVDVQAAFDEATVHHHPMALSWDRIHPGVPGHPGTPGHMIIARAFLKAIGFEW
jgi:lysophospholipase L1-like esterase